MSFPRNRFHRRPLRSVCIWRGAASIAKMPWRRLALGFAVLCLAGLLAVLLGAGCEDEGILVSGHEVDRGPDIPTSYSFLAPV